MEHWREYITTHFHAFQMRPVSGFDPSGFIMILGVAILSLGIISALLRYLWSSKDYQQVRERMEQNMQELSDYLDENLEYVKLQAQRHSGTQGFVAEMLSFAYLSRLAFSITVFFIASYLNALAATVSGWRTPNVVILDLDKKPTDAKTLPDLGHDAFNYVMSKKYGDATENIEEWFHLPDQFIMTVGSITALLLLIHPRKLLIIRRLCVIFAFINLLRALCVAATSMPDASPMCHAQFDDPERGSYKRKPVFPRAFIRAFYVLLFPSNYITCGDMVFSGHTVFLMLSSMIMKTYCIREELNTPFTRKFQYVTRIIRYSVYVIVFFAIFAIIGTRLHYTLDVLIAMYVTTQTWFMYHWLSKHPALGWKVINWLEAEEVHFIDRDAYRLARQYSAQTMDAHSSDGETKKSN